MDQTKGSTIIMGRKTYEENNVAIPDRNTIVLTSNKSLHLKDALVAHSLDDAINLGYKNNLSSSDIWIGRNI